jgi:hypothetical protein
MVTNEIPEPIRPLSVDGLNFWNRIWSIGRVWVSAQTDIELLQLICEQVDERAELRELLAESQSADTRKALRELEKSLVANLSLMGFTPSDRSRLGVAEVTRMSKVEELRAKYQD